MSSFLVEINQTTTHFTADGGFSDFGEWSECSGPEICGEGTQTRSRTCTNPAPAHGGADCEGEASQTQTCHIRDCPGNKRTK